MIFLVLCKLELTNYILKHTNLFILMVCFLSTCTGMYMYYNNFFKLGTYCKSVLAWHTNVVTNSFR